MYIKTELSVNSSFVSTSQGLVTPTVALQFCFEAFAPIVLAFLCTRTVALDVSLSSALGAQDDCLSKTYVLNTVHFTQRQQFLWTQFELVSAVGYF